MEGSTFTDMNLIFTRFIKCQIQYSQFESCNLNESSFQKSNLYEVLFNNCSLLAVDFTMAENYQINISQNFMKGSKHDSISALGLLYGSGIVIN